LNIYVLCTLSIEGEIAMAGKSTRLKGVGAFSIVTVGLAMGATPTLGTGAEVPGAARADSCNDFARALFIKGNDLFNKAEPFLKFDGRANLFLKIDGRANPFLKYEGVETGFLKNGLNVGGFYQVSTGAAEVFLKDALNDANMPVIAYCVADGHNVTRGFFDKTTNFNSGTTLDGAQISFSKVDNKQAFLKITLESVFIETSFSVGEDGTTSVQITEDANPVSFE
jgi:hypothetical protein